MLSVGNFRDLSTGVDHACCRVKLEDRLAAVTSARESADSAAVAREMDCERQLDHLDSDLQVWLPMQSPLAFPQLQAASHMQRRHIRTSHVCRQRTLTM